MLHHFRFIIPLLGKDEDGLTPLHYYDSAIQLARHTSREPTEQEYIVGMRAAQEIRTMSVFTFAFTVLTHGSCWTTCSLQECLLGMHEGSTTDLSTRALFP